MTFKRSEPKPEQTAILNAIAQEFNACVDAVPGSGKTPSPF